MATKFVSSKKFTGVRYKELDDGDRSYQIRYKVGRKLCEESIGKKSEGVTEQFCHQKRNEAINKAKFGDNTPTIKYKKRKLITLQDLANVYFEEHYDNKSNARQLGRYLLHIKPIFADMDINDLAREHILKWRKGLIDKNKAPKTTNGIVQLLSIMINYSIKYKELKITNPCIGIKQLKTDDKREKYLSIAEINILKQKVSKDQELYSFVLLSLNTGGRLETIMNVQKKDINLTSNSITLLDTKNGLTYSGFFDNETKEHLSTILPSLNLNDYVIGCKPIRCPTRRVQRKLQNILNESFNIGLEKNDRKNRTVIHTLRHTFASHLAINGVPIFTIKKLMNHADIEQTMRYAKLAPDSGLDAIKTLYSDSK
jgi:integrase